MKKTILLIVILLGLIGAVSYYGYVTVLSPRSISETQADIIFAELDADTQEMLNGELSDDTALEIDQLLVASSEVAIVPATVADIDTLVSELNTFSLSDTSSYNTSLSDL